MKRGGKGGKKRKRDNRTGKKNNDNKRKLQYESHISQAPQKALIISLLSQALEGGGAKSINFQELASDLAQITFDYPFRIPPYFALIIRAIGVLEGIALVGDPDFAIVDESYPYIARRLLTDSSQTSQEALRYMIYGQGNVFDVDRLIDILEAFEEFTVAVSSARGMVASGTCL